MLPNFAVGVFTAGFYVLVFLRLMSEGGYFLEVTVYQNQVERALKVLKRQLTKDGMLKELKRRRFYEKPSIKKKRKQKEAKKKRKAAIRRSTSFFHM